MLKAADVPTFRVWIFTLRPLRVYALSKIAFIMGKFFENVLSQ